MKSRIFTMDYQTFQVIESVDNGKIHISISYVNPSLYKSKIISWETIQKIKNMFYPDKVFVEYYPKRDDVVNLGNIRHIWEEMQNDTL